MTVTYKWCAGAESDGANSHLAELVTYFSAGGGYISSPTTRPHTGARHFRLYCPRQVSATNYAYMYRPITATRQGRLGLWIMADFTQSFNSDFGVLGFRGAGQVIDLRVPVSALTSLGMYVNTVAYGGAPTATMANFVGAVWHHYCIDFKIHSSTGWCRVWQDGVQVMDFSGNTGNEDVTVFTLGHVYGSLNTGLAGNCIIDYDDMIFYDTTGEGAPALCSSDILRWFEHTADGTKGEWTCSTGVNHLANLDDIPNTGDTDFNYAGSSGLKDSFTHGAFARDVGYNVVATIPTHIVRRTDTAIASTLKSYALNNGFEGESSEVTALPPYYMAITEGRILVDPNTGAAWTDSGINNAEFGIESAGVYA